MPGIKQNPYVNLTEYTQVKNLFPKTNLRRWLPFLPFAQGTCAKFFLKRQKGLTESGTVFTRSGKITRNHLEGELNIH